MAITKPIKGIIGACLTPVDENDRVTLAAMAISWVRMVAVTALAWNRPARAPTARVRLNAIAASASHAELAVNDPDVISSRCTGVRDVQQAC